MTKCFLYLIQVEDDPNEKDKPSWVDFKNAVWHESTKTVLKTMVAHVKAGCSHIGGDKLLRELYPILLMISCDYEEA